LSQIRVQIAYMRASGRAILHRQAREEERQAYLVECSSRRRRASRFCYAGRKGGPGHKGVVAGGGAREGAESLLPAPARYWNVGAGKGGKAGGGEELEQLRGSEEFEQSFG
jgi:hypothetical protein